MFELPGAKRVRRSDLYSPASSREPSVDENAIERLRKSIAFDTSIATLPVAQESQNGDGNIDQEDNDEVVFRLFARTAHGAQQPATQTVRIRSPTPAEAESGFVISTRPQSYYFTGKLSDAIRHEYELAATSGNEVLQRSRSYWPGSIHAWKTITIPRSQANEALAAERIYAKLLPVESDNNNNNNRRTRLGKKGRIRRRQKLAIKEFKAKEQAETAVAKDRADREKRARRNREKKFKKRARDKAKKLGTDADTMAGSGSDAGNESD